MIQQISDAELEIMKIVWGNPEDVTLFPYIMDGLAARGKPCQKNTLIVLLSRLMNKMVCRVCLYWPARFFSEPPVQYPLMKLLCS